MLWIGIVFILALVPLILGSLPSYAISMSVVYTLALYLVHRLTYLRTDEQVRQLLDQDTDSLSESAQLALHKKMMLLEKTVFDLKRDIDVLEQRIKQQPDWLSQPPHTASPEPVDLSFLDQGVDDQLVQQPQVNPVDEQDDTPLLVMPSLAYEAVLLVASAASPLNAELIQPIAMDLKPNPAPPVTFNITEVVISDQTTQLNPNSNPSMPVTAVEIEPRYDAYTQADHDFHTSPSTQLMQRIWAWFVGGNILVRIGIIILFFGVSFLLKQAASHGLIPIELRYIAVGVGAIILLLIGWRKRELYPAYALIMQGGGIGVLYLLLFAATRQLLMPTFITFVFMFLVCTCAVLLALLQDARPLAVMGAIGGFLAPVLLSTGGGSHVGLFSYYALLNAGIFAVALFKSWRSLNLIGFIFTLGIGSIWGVRSYQADLFWTTEPFLILFFLFYVGIGINYALQQEGIYKRYIDGTLIFGTPLSFILLQHGMLSAYPFAMAFSAIALATLYFSLAYYFMHYRAGRFSLLFESLFALGLLFVTLSVPLACDGALTSAIWALEGAAIVWVSIRQQHQLALVSGVLLQLAAGLVYLATHIDLHATGVLPFLNSYYLGIFMLSAAPIFTAWQLQKLEDQAEWFKASKPLSHIVALWGLSWWICGGILQIKLHVFSAINQLDALLLFMVVTCWLAYALYHYIQLSYADSIGYVQLPVAVLIALAWLLGYIDQPTLMPPPLSGITSSIVWLATLLSIYGWLYRQETKPANHLIEIKHAIGFWLVTGLVAWQLYHVADLFVAGIWRFCAFGAVVGGFLALLSGKLRRYAWPFAAHSRTYAITVATPLVVVSLCWTLVSVLRTGDTSPLPYIPLLNPLDLTQILIFFAILLWYRWIAEQFNHAKINIQDALYPVLGVLFIWLNVALLRILYHYGQGIDYTLLSVLRSFGVQMCFVVLWVGILLFCLWRLRQSIWEERMLKALAPLVVILWIWMLIANFSAQSILWARIPFMNPLDMLVIAIAAALILWIERSKTYLWSNDLVSQLRALIALALFIWINALVIRSLHYFIDVPYRFNALMASMPVQAALSLLWGSLALLVMIYAVKSSKRLPWFMGIALIIMTVGKLFLVELSHIEGIARIVSFIGVGTLLLVIGYFAPLPPINRDDKETA